MFRPKYKFSYDEIRIIVYGSCIKEGMDRIEKALSGLK